MLSDIVGHLGTLVRGCPALYIVSPDLGRVRAILRRIAEETERSFWAWSITQGVRRTFKRDEKADPIDPIEVLGRISKSPNKQIIELENFHTEFESADGALHLPQIALDTIHQCRAEEKTVVFISPVLVLPPVLEKHVYVYEMPLPGRDELSMVLENFAHGNKRKVAPEVAGRCVEAARGLCSTEALTAFALALSEHRSLTEEAIEAIVKAKREGIRRTGLLEVVETDVTFEQIAGIETIKQVIEVARRILLHPKEARAARVEPYKGFVFIGPPGTAKSVCCKAIAHALGCPLLRLDMGMIMADPYSGTAENRMRAALRMAESMAPVVVQIDEINMTLSGSQSSGVTDSGVVNRVIQTLLTFMAEVKEPVLFIGTCNSMDGLPDALTRKGRFDEVYFVDLPETDEREAIWRIHLKRRAVSLTPADVEDLARLTKEFSGAEIEACAQQAVRGAFHEGRPPTMNDVVEAVRQTQPKACSTDYRGKLDRLRKWAGINARPARPKTRGHEVEGPADPGTVQVVGFSQGPAQSDRPAA